MKRKTLVFLPVMMLVMLTIACGTSTPPTSTPLPPPTNTPVPSPTYTPMPSPTFTPPPTPTSTTEPFVGGECQSGTTRIEMNSITTEYVSGGSFPNNCTEFCLWVPDGGSRLDIGISDFNLDLDLFVDPDYEVLLTVDTGEASWESIAYGTSDESVRIYSPGGRYYIQVCSYEGIASEFTLENEYTP